MTSRNFSLNWNAFLPASGVSWILERKYAEPNYQVELDRPPFLFGNNTVPLHNSC